MKFFLLSFVLMVVAATATYAAHVGSGSRDNNNNKPVPAEGFAKASNEFGFHLLKEVIQHRSSSGSRGSSENVLFSPYSVAVALSMVHQGTQGSTAEQFKRVLYYDRVQQLNGGEYQTVANSVKQIQNQIKQSDQSNQFDWGNMLMVDQQIPVKDQYKKIIEQYYDGQVMSVDFRKESKNVMERINQFVSNKTHGLIDRMLEQPPSADTGLALINAVYFKGEWLKPFDSMRTEQSVFYGHHGQEYKNVQYINGQGPYGYVEVPQWNSDLIQLPYKGEDIAFYGVLPRERNYDLDKIRQSINSTFVDEIVGQITGGQSSTVYFPKIELSTSYQLPEILKSMGLQDVFTESADLSGITDKKPMKIDDAIHKAKLILNEQGTEAGAGTYIQMAVLSALETSHTFRFDHPFMYFIRHLPTGQILFLGEIHDF
ncbi:der f 27 allergen [Dermatophagoides farinae]|uniref:Der f 27 allergen n=1 Tax=Dermatophagoides farinae TaxID=6954 RepID=A0A9D4NWR5_DERFA|nr:der f 27 allergen [Dermatophagoides farinae]